MAYASTKKKEKTNEVPATKLAHFEMADAKLLAAQPANPEKADNNASEDWLKLRSHLEQRLVSLRAWRSTWYNTNWDSLATFILPRRSIWLTQGAGGTPTPNSMTRGRQIQSAIVDPTGTLAVRVCAGGLMSGLASPSRPWFKVMPAIKNFEVDAAARTWLDETEARMYSVMAGSNFYNAFAQECEDLVVFGTAPSIIYEDETDIIRLYNPCVGEYYLSSSASMRVDGLYRQFVMTIAQIVDFFGVDNCPEEVRSLWAQKGNALDQEKIIAHSIEPNFGIDKDDAGKVKGNFTWRETYWVYGTASAKPLSLRGFIDQPFTAARWSTQSNDAYGRSPGMDVLPDIMQLQVETRRKAEAIEKQVRPPLLADMQLKNQPSSILPGHVTYVTGLGPGTGMRSIYDVNPEIREMMEDIAAIQTRIQKGFYNDIFSQFSSMPQKDKTAYESSLIQNEVLNRIGPVIENLMTESLKPKLKRIFSILKRRGFIDPPPPSLHGVPLDLQFVSILALAAKAAATGGIERIAQFVGNLAPVYPEAKFYFNAGESIAIMNDLLGNPQKVINDKETAMGAQAAMAKQQQQAQALDAAGKMAQTASTGADAANTLAGTQIGGGANALGILMGQPQGNA